MRKIKLKVSGIYESGSNDNIFTLILEDYKTTKYKLPIIIGAFEAQMIAVSLDNIELERPSLYDIVLNLVSTFKIKIKQALIYNVENGLFLAQLLLVQNKENFELEISISDAINLSIRNNFPVYIYKTILEREGITEAQTTIIDNDLYRISEERSLESGLTKNKNSRKFYNFTNEELETKLKEAIENEDYEIAAQIRDEINIRKNK
ncbi:MAG: bifunctional nuclease domain-containing protein [Solitalea-like symbiont of Tyrophagus putrescentiae]